MAQTKIGGSKVAAGKLGISVEKYIQNVQSGLKWCSACRSWLQSDCFGKDKSSFDGKNSRCKICQRALYQKRYKPIPIEQRKPRGFTTKPSRDGDKNQARAKVNYAVTCNKLPHARNVPCFDCGHIGSDRLHEYDHYKGYDAINHLEVECVCVPCHVKRGRDRINSSKCK
jgi:hypothetical protein